jgi:hypothetical protein
MDVVSSHSYTKVLVHPDLGEQRARNLFATLAYPLVKANNTQPQVKH